MPSSFTTNKNLEKPANGEYVDTWNIPVNGDMDVIDSALGGLQSLTATSGTNTLTTSQYQKLILSISGTLVGNVIYRVPSGVGGWWIVRNSATLGGFTVTIDSAGGGSTVVVPAATVMAVYSDGTNIRQISITTADVLAILSLIDINAGVGLTGGGPLSSDVSLAADFATASQWRSNTDNKVLEPPAIWDSMAEVTLTDSSTISWDMQTGFDFIVTLGGNRTLAAPTNTKVGQKGRLMIVQDGTGSRTLTWNSNFKFANATAPVLSTAAGARDICYYDVRASNYIIITFAGRGFA